MTPERFEKIKNVLKKRQPDATVILDNVHKPHNLAAILRSCDATGIGSIHARSKNDQIGINLKAASGSNHWVKVDVHNDLTRLYQSLKKKGHSIFVANNSKKAVDFREVDYTGSCAIVLGAELDGLSDNSVDYASQEVKIPINGMVDSLNVSVANAVILYEMQRQRLKAGLYESTRLTKEAYHKLLFEFSYPEVALVFRKKSAKYPKLDDYGQIIS